MNRFSFSKNCYICRDRRYSFNRKHHCRLSPAIGGWETDEIPVKLLKDCPLRKHEVKEEKP